MKLSHLIRDFRNRFKYGKNAPYTRQLIWINPQEVRHYLLDDKFTIRRDDSGLVLEGDWDFMVKPFQLNPGMQAHFLDGIPWDEIDVVYSRKNGRSYETIYAELASRKTLRTCSERNPIKNKLLWHREKQGVHIHIGRHGNPIMGNDGYHRISIAKILNVELIPAMVGFVHLQAIQSGAWQNLLSTSKPKP